MTRAVRSALLGVALVALPSVAAAQGAPANVGESAATPPEPTLKVSGFVDSSILVPLTGFAEGARGVSLGLDQLEIDLEATPARGLTLRADVNWFPSSTLASFDDLVEQAFVEVVFGGGEHGVFLKAGKTNAPIGIEAADAPDMLTYSHGLLFSLAAPTNLSGFFAGWRGETVTAMAWLSNDWDTASTPANASAGGRVEIDFGDGHVGVSGTFGPMAADVSQVMVDLDAVVELGSLRLLGNANWGQLDGLGSLGASVMAHYAVSSAHGVTGRFDWIDREFGTVYEGTAATGAWLFSIVDNLAGVVEVRADLPTGADAQVAGAAELIGTF